MSQKETALISYLGHDINRLQKDFETFTSAFLNNPSGTLEWSHNTFNQAIDQKLFRNTITALKTTNLKTTIYDLKDDLHFKMKNFSYSTSPVANILAQIELTRIARLIERLENFEEHSIW